MGRPRVARLARLRVAAAGRAAGGGAAPHLRRRSSREDRPRRAGPAGRQRARSPPYPPRGHRGLPGLPDRRADRSRRAERKWVTGRINTQVPYREKVDADGVGPRCERLLTVVLNNDPLILKGPEANTWLRRQGRALERRSVMHFGGEVYELGSRARLVVRHACPAWPSGAPRGERAPRRRAAGRRVRPGRRARAPAAARPVRRAGRGRVLRVAQREHVAVRERAGRAGPLPLRGPRAVRRRGRDRHGDQLGPVARRTRRRRDAAHRRRARPRLPADQVPAFISRDADHGVVDNWIPSAAIGAGLLY